jgi:branched-chain amino acid transport system substrate-binding protein
MTRFKNALIALFAAAVMAGCSQSDDIAIGVAGPITGSEAVIGEQFVRGAEKAVADINAAGGVNGKKLRLVKGDDACDPKQAVSVANDFVSQGVVFVAGHYCSGTTIPASDVYAEANIVEISPGSTNPQVTERGLPGMFRVCGRDDAQGPMAAAYFAEKFPGKRLAIVNDKSTYGKGLADQFTVAVREKGVTPVLEESITAGERDYTALVTKLKEVQADYLYFGGYKTEAGLIVRQMREAGLATTLIGGDALVTEEFWTITGPAGEGTLMTFGPDPRLIPENEALVKAFRDSGYEPEAYTLYTYAAIQAWADAANKTGSTDFAKVTAALKEGQFKTALGTIDFNEKGDNSAPGYVFYVWKDGKYVYAQ